MLNYLKQYFIFTKRERIGTYVLVLLIIGILIFRFTISHHSVDQTATIEQFKKDIADFEAAQKAKENFDYTNNNTQPKIYATKNSIAYFKFNPNDASLSDWKKLGLTEKQAASIINYKNKGGKFKSKLDVKKMYTVSDKKYLELEPYIDLPERYIASAPNTKKEIMGDRIKTKPKDDFLPTIDAPLELNLTNAYKLSTLLNVEQELAANIIKYRNYLHGFLSTKQLLEVEGMDSTSYHTLLPFVKANPSIIRKININADSSRDLWHPYISKGLQKNIFNYRQIHGDYKSLEDLKKLALINDEIYRKLVPYLTTE